MDKLTSDGKLPIWSGEDRLPRAQHEILLLLLDLLAIRTLPRVLLLPGRAHRWSYLQL